MGLVVERMRVVLFGAGGVGRRLFDLLSEEDEVEVIAFVDNDPDKHGSVYRKIPIFAPKKLKDLNFQKLYYATQMGIGELEEQLKQLGVSKTEIDKTYVETISQARALSLQRSAELVTKGSAQGAVAEAGVYRGEFARQINRIFPERKFYLFDTFTGFDERDIPFEDKDSLVRASHFKDTSVGRVKAKMSNINVCDFRQGFFPETTKGINDEFIFVSLDLDLYKPTYEGLLFFWPRMVSGGHIFIHDYFLPSYPNVAKAVSDFELALGTKVPKCPIGDDLSLALIKP